nr:PREDICTED: uncharacterized protein LOC102275015 [Bos mutus]
MATEAIIKFIFKEEIGSVFEKMASYDEGGLGSLLAVVMSIDQGCALLLFLQCELLIHPFLSSTLRDACCPVLPELVKSRSAVNLIPKPHLISQVQDSHSKAETRKIAEAAWQKLEPAKVVPHLQIQPTTNLGLVESVDVDLQIQTANCILLFLLEYVSGETLSLEIWDIQLYLLEVIRGQLVQVSRPEASYRTLPLPAPQKADHSSRILYPRRGSLLPKMMNADMDAVDAENQVELEEKTRLINQVLELQHTLEDLSARVDAVKEENLKLKSENQVLKQYIENLMSASSVFQTTDTKSKRK